MSEENKYDKPLPEFRPETKPFWDSCKKHELLLPKSKTTNEFFFYPRAVSPDDDMSDVIWEKASGKAKVWTYSIHHMGPTKAYKGDGPYVVALVETEEGVKMMTNIIDCDPKDVYVGMDVEVVFDDVTPEVTLPKFKPVIL